MYKIRLSPYHKIFYNEWKLDPSSSKYNIVFDQTISKNLDVRRLQVAFSRFVSEHILFNSHIIEESNEIYWIRNNKIHQPKYFVNGYENEDIFAYVVQPFLLDVGSLYRMAIFLNKDNTHRLILVLHHLLIDGLSLNALIAEISKYYNSDNYTRMNFSEQLTAIEGTTKILEKQLENKEEECSSFWNDLLAHTEPVDLRFLNFGQINSLDFQKNRPIEFRFCFNSNILTELTYIASKYKITPYLFSLCIFAILLNRYTSQEKFAISYPIAIINNPDFICGSRVNTNLIVFNIRQDTTILDLLTQTNVYFDSLKKDKKQCSYYPINKIMDTANNMLLDIMFAKTNLRNISFNFIDVPTLKINNEFSLDIPTKIVFAYEIDTGEIHYSVRCNNPKVDKIVLQNFITHYKKLFTETIEDLKKNLGKKLVRQCDILLPKEYQRIIYDWNNTYRPYVLYKTAIEIFEAKAAEFPNNIAVEYKDSKLTYHELNCKANQLAHYMQNTYRLSHEELIILCLEKNELLIIAVLAVLKLGHAYVPINLKKSPLNRVIHILKDTKAKIILLNEMEVNKLYNIVNNQDIHLQHIIPIDNINLNNIISTQNKNQPVLRNVTCKNLLYVIYTSGTTGNPKGVMVEDRNVVNYVTYLIAANKLNGSSIGSQYADFSFDAHVIEIYPILLSGAKLCIMKEEDRLDPNKINDFFVCNKVSYAFLPTQIAQLFFMLKNKSLKNLIVGGDELRTFTDQSYKVTNAYGPTEITVQSNSFLVEHARGRIPIGKPIINVTNYVLDPYMSPLPIGAIGELYIGGDGVARGYLSNIERTIERFKENPFCSLQDRKLLRNTVLYKTGDLVRYLNDGNLEYIGRNDTQVKIRGYRVEIGEVEAHVMRLSNIDQVLVIAMDDGYNDKYLCAYYIGYKEINTARIKHKLRACLNDYMIPEHFIKIEYFPVNTSGKIDYNLLPKPYHNSNNYLEPKNQKEQLICEEFTKVLKVEKIGVNDDFFNLGGNSINAIRLVSNLRINFDVNLDDVFTLRTPKLLADNVTFGNNTLQQLLKEAKQSYKKNKITKEQVESEKSSYFKTLSNIQITRDLTTKPIINVLLTGATGYLGCNILNQLLIQTEYKLILLIRANSEAEAFQRITQKFQFYFNKKLDHFFYSRILVFRSDITKNNLGLSSEQYKALSLQTDSIIHSAALVKHYGEYDNFFLNNVIATRNLLELSKLTKHRDFHYISTYSVLIHNRAINYNKVVYTEYDQPNNLEDCNNFYIKTKLQGELEVAKYINCGISANIYRVGNLAFISENCKIQDNANDNAFSSWLRCLLKLECIPPEIDTVEISPVDITAQAIVKLFDKQQLINEVYHVFNPYLFTISDELVDIIPIEKFSMEKFIDCLSKNLNNSDYHDLIIRFLLHQGWLDKSCNKDMLSFQVLQNRTQNILKLLGFEWKPIEKKIFKGYIETLLELYPIQFKKLEKNISLRRDIMIKKARMIEDLERLAPLLPTPIYWTNKKSVVIGVNNQVLVAAGASSYDVMVGKTPYDFYPKEMAKKIILHNEEVMRTGKILSQEETIKDISTGKIKYFNAVKAPLYDDNDAIIGIVGTSVEITAEKEAERLKHDNRKLEAENKIKHMMFEKESAESERLRLENEVHIIEKQAAETIAKEQQGFRTVADRVAHDLRPPVASITHISKSQAINLPEEERITLRDAGNRINDLANYLLSYYKPTIFDQEAQNTSVLLLVSGAITEILSEKRWEYTNLPVKFINKFNQDSYFTFIDIPAVAFKSMLSNLINNSVDAFEKNAGEVIVGLECDTDTVKITVEDNGKGMPPELVDKIMNNIAFTAGKENGHGIGLTQFRETLAQNKGSFTVDSKPGVGTKIILNFPKAATPDSVCEKLELKDDDIIIVVDDDPSIHGSWDSRFADVAPHFKLKHFDQGNEAINFINGLQPKDKQKVFLLTDYELLKQGLDGLDIIQKTGIKRSVLVTSRYEDKQVQDSAAATKTKILPKLLALEVPILVAGVTNKPVQQKTDTASLLPIELIMVDDYEPLTKDLKRTVLKGRNVAVFNDVHSFLDNVYKYKRDSKIILDNNFENYEGGIEGITFMNTGFSLAKKLHNDGFSNLYLASGDKFSSVPDYLTVIAKHHYDDIEALLSPNIQQQAPKPDFLTRSEMFREIMLNFIFANCRDNRYGLSDIDDMAHKTQKGQLKSKASDMRMSSISKSAREIQKKLEDNCDIASQAEKIFNGTLGDDTEFFEYSISESLIHELLRIALKKDAHLLDNFDIRNPHHFEPFTFLGNRLIIELIISILLRYAANQIKQQKGVGSIHLDTDSTAKHNQFLINYTLQMKDGSPLKQPASFESLPDYSENLEFCKNAIQLFGSEINLSPNTLDGTTFVLSFPKVAQASLKKKRLQELK